jgi:hypothetical protein
MSESNDMSKIGEGHILKHLGKQGYNIGNCETVSPFSSFIEAEKMNKKYVFLVNTAAFADPDDALNYKYDMVYEERRELLSRAQNNGAIAMVAVLKVSGAGTPGGSGELLEPIKFKVL